MRDRTNGCRDARRMIRDLRGILALACAFAAAVAQTSAAAPPKKQAAVRQPTPAAAPGAAASTVGPPAPAQQPPAAPEQAAGFRIDQPGTITFTVGVKIVGKLEKPEVVIFLPKEKSYYRPVKFAHSFGQDILEPLPLDPAVETAGAGERKQATR